MADTSIEWTDRVWNHVRGCSLTSPGCVACYAMRQAHRFSGPDQPYEGLTRLGSKGPIWTGDIRMAPEKLTEPLHWRKPSLVFVNSMSDLFHEGVSDEFIAATFAVMRVASWHTFQILTKRAERLCFLLSDPCFPAWVHEQIETLRPTLERIRGDWSLVSPTSWDLKHGQGWPLPNVWCGVSCEDRKHGLPRVDVLRSVPAAVRFVSYEPLLEDLGQIDLSGIDLAIVGGESGPGARPCDVDWIRSIVRQCKAADAAAFVKQLGAKPYRLVMDGRPTSADDDEHTIRQEWLRLIDRKGGDPEEWAADLRVREMPAPATV